MKKIPDGNQNEFYVVNITIFFDYKNNICYNTSYKRGVFNE